MKLFKDIRLWIKAFIICDGDFQKLCRSHAVHIITGTGKAKDIKINALAVYINQPLTCQNVNISMYALDMNDGMKMMRIGY